MSNKSTRLTADKAARFLDRSIAKGGLDPATAQDAQTLVDAIDAGPVKGLAGQAGELISAGFRRGALAVAAAESPREVRAAVAGIKAVAALADSLGIEAEVDAVADTVADAEADTVSDTATVDSGVTNWSAA